MQTLVMGWRQDGLGGWAHTQHHTWWTCTCTCACPCTQVVCGVSVWANLRVCGIVLSDDLDSRLLGSLEAMATDGTDHCSGGYALDTRTRGGDGVVGTRGVMESCDRMEWCDGVVGTLLCGCER